MTKTNWKIVYTVLYKQISYFRTLVDILRMVFKLLPVSANRREFFADGQIPLNFSFLL